MNNNHNTASDKEIETVTLPYDKASVSKKRKKRKGWKKRLLIGMSIFIATLFLLIGTGLYVIFYYIDKIDIVTDNPDNYTTILDPDDEDVDLTASNSPDDEINDLESGVKQNAESDREVLHSDQVTNILLIGTDGRTASERGRSDSMILVSINKVSGKIIMTSFLRDTYVDIPGVSKNNRLNAAYSSGGANLLLDTIETNFKIKIDQYVRVNFDSFKDTIDLLGGVEMTVTNAEAGHIPDISSGGTYILNGEQALAYSRIRKVGSDGDFGRTERQRKVLSVLLEKCKKLSITELTNLLDQILPNLTTNIPKTEIFSHIMSSPTYFGYELVQQQIPCDGSWSYMTVRQMSVLRVDFEKNHEQLKKTIYEGIY